MKALFMMINLLNMYKVVWTNTTIEIPLDDNTYQYYEIPEAKLYKNGILVINESYYYERGVNRTSLTVVNSNHVKEFRIDYRVTFDDIGIRSEQTIVFKIVDNIPPKVIKVPTFRFPVNTKIPSEKVLLENLYYIDNYYENKDIIVNINNLEDININKIGIYNIEYALMDPSYNTTKVTTTYEIFDNKFPVIEYKEPLIHNYNEIFSHYNYFKYIGNNLTIEVDDSNINFNKIGTYPIIIKATNLSNLTTTISTMITIKDVNKPTITVKSNIEPINVGAIITNELLLSYIFSVDDNYDDLSIQDVKVINDINTKITGKYLVKYNLKDSSGNEANASVNVLVKDLEKPKITSNKALIFNVLEPKPYWLNYFIIDDNYDDFENLKVNFKDSKIDFNTIGTYYLTIEVSDNAKNNKIKTYEVKVKDLIAPTIEIVNDIYIYDFKKGTNDFYKSHFNINDNYNNYNDITIFVDDENVNYSKVGEYEITVKFTDLSNNESLTTISVFILDIYEPSIVLLNYDMIYFIEGKKPSYYDNILEVTDNFDHLQIEDVIINDNVNYDKTGKYEVIYSVQDSSFNKKQVILTVFVDKKIEKLINGSNIEINTNGTWNEYDKIALSSSVVKSQIYYEYFKTDKPAKIEVLYVAYDIRGNYEEFVQTIDIIEYEDNSHTIKDYSKLILLTISLIAVIGVIMYIDKRKTNINF